MDFKVGGLYSLQNKQGEIKVAKVLAVDERGAHVRVYKNSFPGRPQEVDPEVLELGRYDDKDFSAGHLPVIFGAFERMKPVFISPQEVSSEELEGYNIWKKDKGGYFTTDIY